jgi:hypothetical protein
MRHSLSLVLICEGESDARSERPVGQQRLAIENSVIPKEAALECEYKHHDNVFLAEQWVS